MKPVESFSSRWGLIFAALGMAVGTGNIWRFPRIAALNGGGAFLVPWLVFFILWSLPLLLVELALGRRFRQGTVGVFHRLLGRKFAWMGAFVGVTATAIMCYYSVVTGWCLRYMVWYLGGAVGQSDPMQVWNGFTDSLQPLFYHLVIIILAGWIVFRGVRRGIETVTRIMIPAIWIIFGVAFVYLLLQPGSMKGLAFLYSPDWSRLADYNTWLNALTQTAWSTGAGWGLLLSYAVYSRDKEDIVLNSYITGFGNNSVSLIAAMVIFPAVFAFVPAGMSPVTLMQQSGPAGTGLTFIWMPQLFANMPGGLIMGILFFVSLLVAAFSSLIAMVEMAVRNIEDLGARRRTAILLVTGGAFLVGVPSALDINFLTNQDWVWSVGLLLSGFFFAILVWKYGVRRFRYECINVEGNDVHLGPWFDWVIKYCIPVEFVAVVGWWFWNSLQDSSQAWWDPLGNWSIGTCLIQWGLVILLFALLAGWMDRRLRRV